MIVIPCPHCGPRNHDEFTYAGDASRDRPASDASPEAWAAYVYERENRRGPHAELWRHVMGCGAFVIVERDTATHSVISVRLARQVPEGGP
jgi:heterotetrameric sarcosine oxidase delta subunit